MSTLVKRFLSKITIPDGSFCWEWTATKVKNGYGWMWAEDGKYKQAHRVSYEIHLGEIPDGMRVLHKCDNPGCVNPCHLFLGTQADNVRDCTVKGRRNQNRDTCPETGRFIRSASSP